MITVNFRWQNETGHHEREMEISKAAQPSASVVQASRFSPSLGEDGSRNMGGLKWTAQGKLQEQ